MATVAEAYSEVKEAEFHEVTALAVGWLAGISEVFEKYGRPELVPSALREFMLRVEGLANEFYDSQAA